MNKKFTLLFSVFCVILIAGAQEYWAPKQKKLIDCGWAQAIGVERLHANIEMIEAHTPFHGVSIRLHGRDAKGVKFAANYGFSPEPDAGRGVEVERWEYDFFKEDVALLKATKFKKFTDNFIWVNSRDGNIDWFNDDQWGKVCNNFGILARVAKETGLKGIIFDAEWYRKSKPVFGTLTPGKTYDETAAKARQRGREWGKAMFDAYPDMKLFFIFGFAWKEGMRNTPECSSLMIPFLNGVYDVVPPTVTIIEGHEYHGYSAATEADFVNLRFDVKSDILQKMVDPANIKKYRAQTEFATALYLDPYMNDKIGDSTFMKHLRPHFEKAPKLTVLRRNLVRAMAVSDEYVWVWSECAKWFPKIIPHPGCRLMWEDLKPGAGRTIESACDPLTYAKAEVASGRAKNIASDPTMSADFIRPNRPRYYDFWKSGTKGSCVKAEKAGHDGKDALLITGSNSLFTLAQTYNVKGDQLYYVRARIKKVNNKSGQYCLMVAYVDNLKRAAMGRTTVTARFGEPDADGWQIAEMAVSVPENMAKMHVRICGNWMFENDQIIADMMEVYKIDDGHALPLKR